ncbi:TipAS antibiotic-recognition domain-containing protein [Thermocatellispora tengchongensis]|uniref:TipAS antibiotic-recognition domain-containing protein n=1 Tax=Thermocatellispora tengchongensis TaxID=1073253 RepID=UPI003632D4E3
MRDPGRSVRRHGDASAAAARAAVDAHPAAGGHGRGCGHGAGGAHDGHQVDAARAAEVFGEFRPEDHAAEAERRWGGSAAWQESQRRMGSMTGQDWVRFKDEGALVVDGFLKALADGEPAGGERAMELAEQHRAHITRWCYECTYDIHRGLGDLYVSDPRFTAAYDSQAPGLAAYIREAIHANAERAEARG